MTTEQVLELRKALNRADLAITVTDSRDPALSGEQLVYTLTVSNKGPNPASDVRLVNTLPPGVSFVSATGNCVEDMSGTVTCDLGELRARKSGQVLVTVHIDANIVHKVVGPTIITNEASVENLAGPDPDLSNNTASEDTLVIAPPP